MLDWPTIDTVLLDMDGTLLDLRFDNHFWLDHLPLRYAQQFGRHADEVKAELESAYDELQGKLEWYCVDYWQQRLNIDIMALKREVTHYIKLRADTEPFLKALRASGRRLILLTNAHPKPLQLKLEHTGMAPLLDELLSTHTFGVPKEDLRLWQRVQAHTGYDPERTLLVDDNETVLKTARQAGVRHLLAVSNPDSGKHERLLPGFVNTRNYVDLIPQIEANPRS